MDGMLDIPVESVWYLYSHGLHVKKSTFKPYNVDLPLPGTTHNTLTHHVSRSHIDYNNCNTSLYRR